MDLDEWISCWIKDVPYVWINGNTPYDCKRMYLVEPTQIVYLNKYIGSIEENYLDYLQTLKLIPGNVPVYLIGPTCEFSNLFQVYTGNYKNLPALRCNGKPALNVDIPNQKLVILAHNEEFPCKEEKDFPTTIRPQSRLLNALWKSPLQQDVRGLITKRVRSIDYRTLINLLNTSDDTSVYKVLSQHVKRGPSHQWGEDFDKKMITGRAQSRIDEFKKHLPRTVTSILDVGAGNCEIVLGFAKYLNIPPENIWAIDVEKFADPDISNWLRFERVSAGENFPITDGSIDLVMLFQSMHHMTDLDLKLSEVARVLKPGGTLFIREHDCRDFLTASLIDVEHELYDKVITNSETDYTGTVYRSKFSWTELLKSYGLTLIEYLPTFAKTNPTRYYNAVYKKNI